ncbi:fasciclin domain-containing protein [Arcticibacter eurypsychrophilus]|uniref:fasciclin domain-containing protein n=1 Tax=Arcticibacter eurypsychrophilus TaxID=1434752 RepID=UPI00084D4E43|nr:fasciclin domain-containing protein [Arcticibacter eurypsychrophilus]
MKRSIQSLLCFLVVVLLFTSCRKKEWDDYYGRPEGLAEPIYQQLQAKGNFINFLALADKAGYKDALSGSGSWTLFAPNDAAFPAFFQENGISGIADVSEELATKVVRYSMTYDGEQSSRLSDYLSRTGWIENTAFRRRTVYYDFVYDDKNAAGTSIKAIAGNRLGGYLSNDFNNKNIPIFQTAFTDLVKVTADDYKVFYPNSDYIGFNIGPAKVLADQQDIVAENGVIHVVDKVLVPPLSVDRYIASNDQYKVFRGLLNKFASYSANADVTHRYQVLTGNSDSVYAKIYSASLAFPVNSENFLKEDANDAQISSFSIIAPTDAAVNTYAANVLLKYYPAGTTLDNLFQLNPGILSNFVNSHMYSTPLWASKFATTTNSQGELTHVSLAADVIEKKALSNGFFYGTNKAQDANIFSTVYGNAYLNPTYSIMTKALNYYGFYISLKTATLRYGLILVSDAELMKMGFAYDAYYPTAPFRYNGAADNVMLKRIMDTHIIPLGARAAPNFAGEGVLETNNGEYIRYKGNQLSSSGTMDNNLTIPISSVSTSSNGPAIYAGGALTYTNLLVGKHIEKYGTLPTDPFYYFFQYLKNNLGTKGGIYNATTGEITGVSLGINYTVFVPSKEAIEQAVRDGKLPGAFTATTVTPNFNPTDATGISNVTRFIQYHILNKNSIATDGQKTGRYETLLKNTDGDILGLTITYELNNLKVTDMNGGVAQVVLSNSNVLSNRTLIHQISSYLKFTY